MVSALSLEAADPTEPQVEPPPDGPVPTVPSSPEPP